MSFEDVKSSLRVCTKVIDVYCLKRWVGNKHWFWAPFKNAIFLIESKKLFCCIKHAKAHQITKFCTILWTRFNITDLQSCQICFIGKLIFMVLKSKNLQNRTLANLGMGMHKENSLRYKTLTIWSKFLSYMLLRKMRLDLLIIFYSAGAVGFIK